MSISISDLQVKKITTPPGMPGGFCFYEIYLEKQGYVKTVFERVIAPGQHQAMALALTLPCLNNYIATNFRCIERKAKPTRVIVFR